MNVRIADDDDLPAVLDMYQQLVQGLGMAALVPFNRDGALQTLYSLQRDAGEILVLNVDDKPRGMVLLVAAGAFWNPSIRLAYGVAMWLDPEVRGQGGAKALVVAACEWCEASEIKALLVPVGAAPGLDPERLARLYTSNGFNVVDHFYVRAF